MDRVIRRDTLLDELKSDEDNGAAIHSFDPNASPEAKAASAGKAKVNLQPTNSVQEGREVQLDKATGPPLQPTITVEDFDADKGGEVEPDTPSTAEYDDQPVPGAMPTGPAPAIPDWYKTGWRAVSNIDTPLPEGEERERNVIAMFINDMYYGQWYHNAGIIFFAVLSTYFLTLFRLGWGWLFIVLATCSTYYSASIERVRRASRDDIQRELIKTRLASEHESADWMNNFLDRFWLIYEPVLSATIVSSVDQILSVSTPAFLDSIRMSTFTLGTKAPRINHVRTFPRTADDIVLMDWSISFSSTDTSDLSHPQTIGKINSKIVLEVRVGKGLATAAMPILLENMEFSGDLRIKLKLMTNFPHVQLVEISFMSKPIFDYVLKPIGGEMFGFDINNIPGLSPFIRDMIHGTLGPMMYDPNVFTLNLEQLLSGAPLDAATGVLQVHVSSANGLKGAKIGGGTPDPYVSLSINGRAELARTRFKASTFHPHFGSTHYLLLTTSNLTESLTLTIMDHNDHRKDTELGAASFELSSLAEDAVKEGIVAKVLKDGKDRGSLTFSLSYFPVLEPQKVDGKLQPVPETKVGIVRLTLHQAKELDTTRSLSRDVNPLAKVFLSNAKAPTHITNTVKHTPSPVWESPTEFLVSDKTASVITVKVIDDRDLMKDPVIGYMSIKLEDLLAAKAEQRDWFPLSGCKSGRIRMSAEWKPLAMAGSVSGAGDYTPPIGVVRLWLKKAIDVKNVEAALGGKSDPYVRVMLNSITKARTEVINNNLNPAWDAIVYVPVHSLREILFLEVMDYQNLTKDRSLGYVEVKVADLAQENPENREYPYEGTGQHIGDDPIRLEGNAVKGRLQYVAEFSPALALRGLTFDRSGNELEEAANGSETDMASGDESSESSSDEEAQAVPTGITVKTIRRNGHQKNAKSVDTMNTVDTKASARTDGEGAEVAPPVEEPGVEISRDDLFKSQSGILVVDVIGGQLDKKARLELLLDEGYWPSFSTEKARSTQAKWKEVGEGFIKELDFGRVWLRLNENDEGLKDDIIGEMKMDAKAFLDQCLNKESQFTLTSDDGRRQSTIHLLAKFVPVPITLEPRESINNMGILRVDLMDAKDLRSADRGGKSDPYAVFTLNGQKVFKSETKKKTLAPVWEEDFSVMVLSRVAAQFSVEIFDWNQIEQAKSLGTATIDLTDIEPFLSNERVVHLTDSKHGDKGELRLRMVFNPEIVARSRKNTSTFSVAGRAMTQVGALPFGATKGLAHGVGSAGMKARGLFGGGKGGKERTIEEAIIEVEPPSSQVSQPVAAIGNGNGQAALGKGHPPSAFPSTNTAAPLEENAAPPRANGSLKVTVVGAKDLIGVGDSVKPYVVVKVGEKDYKTKHVGKTVTPEWDEQFSFNVGQDTQTLQVHILDHKTLGKDKLLGEADIDIWRHVQPSIGITNADVWAELREGQGLINLRLQFETVTRRTGSMVGSASSANLSAKNPLASPSRFSLSRRAPTSIDD